MVTIMKNDICPTMVYKGIIFDKHNQQIGIIYDISIDDVKQSYTTYKTSNSEAACLEIYSPTDWIGDRELLETIK